MPVPAKTGKLADVPDITEQQVEELRQAFGLFDKDGDGHVTIHELRVVFETRMLQCPMSVVYRHCAPL